MRCARRGTGVLRRRSASSAAASPAWSASACSRTTSASTDAADAFNAAFRIPNFLQNLFGEGALSASFIPVYASLVARGERSEADRVAGAVASLLALVGERCSCWSGVLATPLLIDAIAPGFTGDEARADDRARPHPVSRRRAAGAVGLVPGRAEQPPPVPALVRGAGDVERGDDRDAACCSARARALPRLAVLLAWGSVVGSALQFAVQLPIVLRLAPDLRFALDTASAHVRTVVRNFVPVFVSRGVVQVSALHRHAARQPAADRRGRRHCSNAQPLYTLPVSLFGMSVSAAELPAMSGAARPTRPALEALRAPARRRAAADRVLRRAVGDGVSRARRRRSPAALLQTGRFTHADARLCLGHPRRVGGRAAGLDARPALFVDLLRAARHADAAALRDRPRRR